MRLLLVLAAAAPLLAQNCSTVTAAFEPTSISAGPATGTLVVSAPLGCPWAFTTDSDWLRRLSGQLFSGTGSGSASATWTATLNTLPVQRQATVTFGGNQITPLTFRLTQAAAPPTTVTLQPDSATAAPFGGTGTFHVETSWYWSAISNAAWITVPVATGGAASGPVEYSVSRNLCASARNGTITVQPASLVALPYLFQIAQSGSLNNMSLLPATVTAPYTAGDGLLTVQTADGCAWVASTYVSWLGITSGASGTGAGTVTYHFAENATAAPRSAVIRVGLHDFTVTQQAAPAATARLDSVVNSASYAAGASPGQIVTLRGVLLGPTAPALTGISPDGESVTKTLGGVSVFFDGSPAPLIFASATQVNAVVPYSVTGKTETEVQVRYGESVSNKLKIAVKESNPAIFTLNASGTGAGAILNEDYSVNGNLNAAARDSVVMIFCTGGGITNPASVDGEFTTTDASKLPRLTQEVAVTIDGQPATVLYSGGAPAAVAGLTQINARIPPGARPGEVPVMVRIGSRESQPGVTVSLR